MSFDDFWTIYEEAFPPDERRDIEAQLKIMEREEYYLKTFYGENGLVGFITYWDLGKILFIEHLAIEKSQRGGGYGGKMMKELMESFKEYYFLLEVEPPTDEISKKRIKFYEKLGFQLNAFDYLQPSYGNGKDPVEMKLMSYPKLIGLGEEKEVVEKIYLGVYQIS